MSRYLLILSISLFSIICENIEIWANNYFYLYELKDDETIFQLEIDEPKDNEKLKIELFLSHPSSYQISFNYTDEKKEEKEEEKIEIEEAEKEEENENIKEEVIFEEETIEEKNEEEEIREKEINEEEKEEKEEEEKEEEEEREEKEEKKEEEKEEKEEKEEEIEVEPEIDEEEIEVEPEIDEEEIEINPEIEEKEIEVKPELEENELKEEEMEEEEIIEEVEEGKEEERKEEKYEEKEEKTNEDEEQIEEETSTIIKINKEKNTSQNNFESTILYLYENNFFEKSLRKLYEYPNNLIEIEEDFSSKKTLILKLNKSMTFIHLIIKKIKHIPKEITSFCYIKYQMNEKNFKNYKFENNITATLINRDVSVSFKGIVPIGENIINDFEVEYNAYLYRKQDQYEYENINHIFLPNRYIAQSGSKKVTSTNERTYDLILSGNEQNGKEQWLEVIAHIKYGNDRECFIYNVTLVDVEYKNGVKPDDNKPDNNTNKDNLNDDSEDDLKFYLIITIFAGVIILIFVIVFVVILRKNVKHDIEDDENDNLIN